MVKYRCRQYEILEAMHQFGGSFVRNLAVLFRSADADNQRILSAAFEKYFRQYDELAALRGVPADSAPERHE